MELEFFDKAREIMEKLENTQRDNIHRADLSLSEAEASFRRMEAGILTQRP